MKVLYCIEGVVTLDEKEVNYSLRLPPKLHGDMKDIAKEEGRSLHAQIIRVLSEFAAAKQRERVDQLEHEQTQGYRSLEEGEQALRQTCPQCGDKHVALFNPSTGASQCRACNATFFVNAKPRP